MRKLLKEIEKLEKFTGELPLRDKEKLDKLYEELSRRCK